jgi:hypothetical protein
MAEVEFNVPAGEPVGGAAVISASPVDAPRGGTTLGWPIPPVAVVELVALATSLVLTFVIASGGNLADANFNVVLALLLALGRYSAPILPALLIVSAFGFDSLLDRWRARHA